MKIKSALLTSMSGSIGGMTGARNRGGLYLRARTIPVNPNTQRQRDVRDALSTLVARWNDELSDAERAAWDLYASQVPLTDALGDEIQVSGVNMYVRSNTARLAAGSNPIDAAPTIFALAPLVSLSGTGVTNAASANLVVAFNTPGSWNSGPNNRLLVYCSRPENSGRVPKGPFRLAGVVEGNSGSPPASATFTTPFVVAAGQRVRIEARLSLFDGRLSTRSSVEVVVGTP